MCFSRYIHHFSAKRMRDTGPTPPILTILFNFVLSDVSPCTQKKSSRRKKKRTIRNSILRAVDLVTGILGKFVGYYEIHRKMNLDILFLGLLEQLVDNLRSFLIVERVPDADSLGDLEESVGHSSAD